MVCDLVWWCGGVVVWMRGGVDVWMCGGVVMWLDEFRYIAIL